MEMVPGSDRNEMVVDLAYGLSSELISPHLLAPRAHAGAPLHIGEKAWQYTTTAPLSSELWHHTAYPAESKPEATWAQPLSREELS
jgi:hypothetical protein